MSFWVMASRPRPIARAPAAVAGAAPGHTVPSRAHPARTSMLRSAAQHDEATTAELGPRSQTGRHHLHRGRLGVSPHAGMFVTVSGCSLDQLCRSTVPDEESQYERGSFG